MKKNDVDAILTILKQMEEQFERNAYGSYDPCDIKALPFIIKYYTRFSDRSYSKYAIYPLERLIEWFPGVYRWLSGIEKQSFAQSHALIVRGNLLLYKLLNNSFYLNKSKDLIYWILDQKSGLTKYSAWGQPYDWFSKNLIPANTPRTTVTAQILQTVIDLYMMEKNEQWHTIIRDICNFFLFEMIRSKDSEDEVCFSYTTIDNYKVHNANMMAASALYRASQILSDKEILDTASKCLAFTMNRQNKDGSWYYYELNDQTPSKIDNYHTGYILEALAIIKNILGDQFQYDRNFNMGVEYYLSEFFQDHTIPKMTPDSLYPIDIQSCAQSIITLVHLSEYLGGSIQLAENVLRFTLKHFYNNDGWFSYQITRKRHTRKISYIRWGDAWMYLAIISFLKLITDE